MLIQRESQKISDLKAQLNFISAKEVKAREELGECQKKHEEQRKKLEEKVHALQKDKFQLTDDLEKVSYLNVSKILGLFYKSKTLLIPLKTGVHILGLL